MQFDNILVPNRRSCLQPVGNLHDLSGGLNADSMISSMDVDSDMTNVAVGQFDGIVRILGSLKGNTRNTLVSENMESPATCLRWRPNLIEGKSTQNIISMVRANGVIEHFNT